MRFDGDSGLQTFADRSIGSYPPKLVGALFLFLVRCLLLISSGMESLGRNETNGQFSTTSSPFPVQMLINCTALRCGEEGEASNETPRSTIREGEEISVGSLIRPY